MELKLLNDSEFLNYCIERDSEYVEKLQKEVDSAENLLISKKRFLAELKENIRKMLSEVK